MLKATFFNGLWWSVFNLESNSYPVKNPRGVEYGNLVDHSLFLYEALNIDQM